MKILIMAGVTAVNANGMLMADILKLKHEVVMFNWMGGKFWRLEKDKDLSIEDLEIRVCRRGIQEKYLFEGFKEFCEKEKFDLVIQTGIRTIEFLKIVKNLGVKCVVWYPDVYFIYWERESIIEVLNLVDLFISTMKGHVDMAEEFTDKVVWVPHYFADNFYRGSNIRGNFVFDVCFVGNKTQFSQHRVEYLKYLQDRGIILKIQGHGFENSRAEYRGDTIARLYNQCKIGLNIATKGIYESELQFSARVYQIMGCGAMLLTEKIPNMDQLFREGKDYVAFDSKEDMLEKIKFFINNDEEREKIAKSGKDEIFKNHLIDRRVNQMMKIINERVLCVSGL